MLWTKGAWCTSCPQGYGRGGWFLDPAGGMGSQQVDDERCRVFLHTPAETWPVDFPMGRHFYMNQCVAELFPRRGVSLA